MAVYGFSRGEKNLMHLPPAHAVQAFTDLLRDNWKDKGSTKLFDEPYSIAMTDDNFIKKLNE
jgi:hypothetical protein